MEVRRQLTVCKFEVTVLQTRLFMPQFVSFLELGTVLEPGPPGLGSGLGTLCGELGKKRLQQGEFHFQIPLFP